MSAFHFLRPEWLWALIPAAIVVALAWRGVARGAGPDWAGTVDAHLLRHLTVGGAEARPSRGLVAALAAGLLAAILAVAGPAWEELPTPTTRGAEPVVVVLSLAQSMNGTDLVPSRLARAGHKLRDILDRAAGEDVGLVIYADRPFVAAPLTPDADVIREMLPELSTSLMPVLGNRLDLAIGAGHDLLSSAGATRGLILVMADDLGADPEASLRAARDARDDGYAVSVMGVGTTEGATLQTADGRAIAVNGGEAPVQRLDSAAMAGLAEAGGGRYAEVTATMADLDRLLPAAASTAMPGRETDIRADRWRDRGYLLLILPVLLMPLAFRRGVFFVLALGLAGLGGVTEPSRAAGLDDLWATPDQQGARAFAAGDYAAAAEAFASPEWRAGALYRAGDYDAAAEGFGADGYNTGNALARAGRFEEALAAYDRHLAAAPDDADAQFNRDLVARLLEEQEQQEQSGEEAQPQQSGGQDQQQGGANDQDADSGNAGSDQSGQPQQGTDVEAGQSGDAAAQGEGQPQQAADGAGTQDQSGAGQPGGERPGAGTGSEPGASGGTQTAADGAAGQSGERPDPEDGAQPEPSQSGSAGGAQPSGGNPEGAASDAMSGTAPGPDDAVASPSPAGAEPDGAAEADATAEPGGLAGDTGGTNPGIATAPSEDGLLSELIDRVLQGNGGGQNPGADAAEAPTASGTPLSQAAEQQLRAVPDDPAGLLRARIRQHYAQLRANGQ
ncbi:VWA domain-containing protein [Roseibacterium sp. SDUM158016]|uniref:VWA domain-containing protein n=1 Tax=Roseicyclus sediminis TaxID=2980997 RepID=UPI0021CF8CBF|nr:VWA domain-containing protein [Roseibacterium sp. SDUM158016]MCU4653300.1 VWA domain-containing protein [Roseibacterium sp. SDUM158016]